MTSAQIHTPIVPTTALRRMRCTVLAGLALLAVGLGATHAETFDVKLQSAQFTLYKDPLLEKVEGVCVVGNTLYFTYDNDFNVADAGSIPSIPAKPHLNGPLVQLELGGSNFPKIFSVPLP